MARPETLRIAIIASHPIQYQVPWFRALSATGIAQVRVFFAAMPTPAEVGVGFGMPVAWDVPLLEGYDWEQLDNVIAQPGVDGFFASRVRGVGAAVGGWNPHAAVITGWESFALIQALAACLRSGIPRLVRGDSNAMKPRPWWKRLVHRTLFRCYTCFLAVGAANRELYLREGVPRERIFPCPHFVDNERLARECKAFRTDREALRRNWGVPADAACLLYVGKLVPKKRILDVLAAVEQARSRTARMHLLVVGEGELAGRARSLASASNLPVSFTGFLNQSEIAKAYAVGDCLILASDYDETWGLVVNEAMACGLPAIVSDRVGCAPDLIQRRGTGTVFEFGNVEGLAAEMLAVATEPLRWRQMGANARELVFREYSLEKAVAGTFQAAEDAVSAHR